MSTGLVVRGTVGRRGDAVVRLRLRGPTGVEVNVDALIDTGFTASMTLPLATVHHLALVGGPGGRARLGDGSVRLFDLYPAQVEWGGRWQPLIVSALGREPLVGMRLLAGHELNIRVVPGGAVEVTALP